MDYFRVTKSYDHRDYPSLEIDHPFTGPKNQRVKWVEDVDFAVCLKWLEHFRSKNIAACITTNQNTKDRRREYHVWREGKDAQEDSQVEELFGDVINECGNFCKKVGVEA